MNVADLVVGVVEADRAAHLGFVIIPEPRTVEAPAAAAAGRVGAWMQTFTGRAVWPLDPRVDEIDPVDIAHVLAHLCRYGGHTRRHLSVAEHCIQMSFAVSPGNARWALLHDATEAYMGDVIRPLKRHLPAYVAAEDRLMTVICQRFGLDPVMPAEVHAADTRILLDERAALMTTPPLPWDGADQVEPPGVDVHGWSPVEAELRFLARLRELGVSG